MEEVQFIQYNYIGEFAGLIIGGFTLLLMLYASPKKTYVYQFVFKGMILSIASILVHISILFVANNPDKYYNNFLFIVQLIFFLVCYDGILYFIFSYVNMMSIVRRNQRKEFHLMFGFLSTIYYIGVIVEIASRHYYSVELGGIDITHFVRFYSTAGLVCAIFCLNATISNRKNVARVILHAVLIVVPIDMVLLIAQIITAGRFHSVYTSLTYVPVFSLGYILFHSNPYDETTGGQNVYGLIAYLDKYIGRRKMYISYIDLKTPNVESFGDRVDDIYLKGVAICRAMEAIRPHFKMFRISESKYVNLIEVRDEKQYLSVINSIRGVLDGAKIGSNVPFNYVMVSGRVPDEIETPTKCRQYFEYISRKFKDHNSSHFYVMKPSDYDEFLVNYEISVTLKDIRNRLDPEDERVVVYAQPIYSVETGCFKVAEALTRLKVGDRIINPDLFIPLAEDSGTIHAITCIVLEKVCKVIESFSEYYDFEAISVNISSREMSQEDIYEELMEIIEKYEFDVSKIRFEITESAMFEDFDQAKDNMLQLTRSGIQFYLDDFGTGYSSFERVMNCPVKTIKFDKTLLYKSLDDNRMDDIMSYMIEVFKKNGFVTLMEGVEDESQSQYSMERGFDYIQGYHYAKPEPIEEMKKYFNRKNKF